MKYQQIPLRRLSTAGSKLVPDGGWHPFAAAPRSYYRVADRLVQRVTLEAGEDEDLLGLLERLRPLPAKALRAGFREELLLRVVDDRYALGGVLVRSFLGWDQLAHAVARFDASLRHFGGNTLECVILFDAWTPAELARAMTLAKAVSSVGAMLAEDARAGIPHTQPEVDGLLRSAHEVLLEEIAEVLAEMAAETHPAEAPHGGTAETPVPTARQARLRRRQAGEQVRASQMPLFREPLH